jgi:hypothetical protein
LFSLYITKLGFVHVFIKKPGLGFGLSLVSREVNVYGRHVEQDAWAGLAGINGTT